MKLIAQNRKATFNYFIEATFNAGIVLEGWEVKAIRAGKAQISEAHIIVANEELFLLNSHISPLKTAVSYIKTDPTRSRKLLMQKHEISKLIGKVAERGFTLVPLDLHFDKGRVKVSVGLAKGKKLFDKRETIKERDNARELARAE